MVFFNYSTMQMAAKIVYYGPGLCGKTTNLQWIYSRTQEGSRGEMVSLETETDRTLFFDLLPIDVGQIAGFATRIQLYTVPGQVFYNTTRKLVLKGVDGVVFVADSQRAMLDANVDSFRNLEENLAEMGLSVDSVPLVLQYNKRDLADICSVEELERALNRKGWPYREAIALEGEGVLETLKTVSRSTLMSLKGRLAGDREAPRPSRPAAGRAATAAPGAGRGPAGRTPAAPSPAAGSSPAVSAKPSATGADEAPAGAPGTLSPAAGGAAAAAPAHSRASAAPGRRTVDVEGELARLHRDARTGAAAGLAGGEPRTNGRRELSRDIRLTLDRDDLRRTRQLTLSFQVEDEERRVVEAVEGLTIDLADSPADLRQLLLRLSVYLNARD